MNHSRSFPVSLVHAWRGQVATISPRSGLRYRVLHQQDTLFPRFAAYYAELRALPKAARRQLQRHWARSLAGVALLFALGHGSAQAAQFTVGNAAQLNAAITTANNTTAADTITLTQDIVLTTPAAVAADGNTGTVVVRSAITIEGQGRTISRTPGAPEFRLLRVASEGKLTVRQTTLRGGQVTGNEQTGGGLLNEGSVTLEECTISGNIAHHGGGVESRTHGASQMTLSNSMVSGNSAAEDGGGVRSVTFDSSQVILSNNTVSGNSAYHGGGVVSSTLDASQMTLSNNMVTGNTAFRSGGGVLSLTRGRSRVTLSTSTISGNSAVEDGGGVWSRTYDSSQLTLSTSTISGNSADDEGGGMQKVTRDSSHMTLSNNTVSGNSAQDGGGVWSLTSETSQMTLSNNTVSGNSASYGGGVFDIARDSSQMTLSSSTITGNSALVGGGVYSLAGNTGQVMLQRMLIAGNRAESGAEVFFYSSGGFFDTAFNLFGHSGLTTADALMGVRVGPSDFLATSDSGFSYALPAILNPTLTHNGGPTRTHNLVPGSLALDAAGACEVTTDQRGAPRPQGSACDIGAVEFQEICGNCKDDDGDGRVDFLDPDCTTGTATITTEQATFTLTPTPRRDELTLTATLPGGKGVNPPRDGLGVQFSDTSGSLLCVHLPPAGAAPKAWKSTGSGRWTFTDAPNGSRGAPSKDAGTVSYNPSKNTLTVQMTIKETDISGTATARNIQTGVGSGKSRWRKGHRWTPKAGGAKLGTP